MMFDEPPMRNNPDDELRDLWQDQKVEGGKMSIDEIRYKASTFERAIRKRNMIEYIAAVVVFVSFGIQMFIAPNEIMAVGNGLVLLGAAYVVYCLHTRGSAQSVPEEMGRETVLDFYRTSLERQRNLLLKVWTWYLLPFVPGVGLILVGAAIRDGVLNLEHPTVRPWLALNVVAVFLICVGVFLGVAAWNKRAARKLQSQIDALKQ
jgi:hypothetical protein